jgi:hypothetical protein
VARGPVPRAALGGSHNNRGRKIVGKVTAELLKAGAVDTAALRRMVEEFAELLDGQMPDVQARGVLAVRRAVQDMGQRALTILHRVLDRPERF